MVHYKLFKYELTDSKGRVIGPDRHRTFFEESRGADFGGAYAKYRGKADAVLMYVRRHNSDFSGLIGRHATERETTTYNRRDDIAERRVVVDDDYPNTPFMCFPRLAFIACVEGQPISANAAMSRLHSILGYRRGVTFYVDALKEAYDLRLATKNLDVVEVNFEVRPVNPHTDDLGRELDEQKKRDHIQRLRGSARAAPGDHLRLDGGLLHAVQQLQQSGHATAGYVAYLNNIQITVGKPARASEMPESEEASELRNTAEIKITIDRPLEYPFVTSDFSEMRGIIRKFAGMSDEV